MKDKRSMERDDGWEGGEAHECSKTGAAPAEGDGPTNLLYVYWR